MCDKIPFFTFFESFVPPRELGLLLHDACVVGGSMDRAERTMELELTASAPLPEAENIGRQNFRLRVEDGVYIVEADWLLKILSGVNMDDYESLQYFQRVLHSSGIIDALKEAGVQEGDTVSIYDLEFDYVN